MPLTVLYCVGSLSLGGTELNAVRTAAAFDPSRVRVVLATFRAKGPLLERYRALGIPIVDLGIRSLADATMPRGLARLARALRTYRPSVVHSHDQFANALCVPAARLGSPALVIASRRWGQSTPHRDRLNRFGSRYAHCVMANSIAVGQFSIREGIPAEKIRIIPNFVDDHAFVRSTPEQRRFWRRANGIPEQAIVIGCVARLDAVKEHAFLIDAFAEVAAERGDVHLALVGDGPLRGSIEERIRASGLGDRISMLGERLNTENLHAGFDVSALVSSREGFPNSVIEAMAAGVPMIGTAVGGVPDAIKHGRTGLVIPSGDMRALVIAIRSLCDNAGLRTRLGETSYLVAREQFSKERVISLWYALYENDPANQSA